MKRFFKKIMSAVVAAAMILSVGTAAPSLSVSAKESVGNGLILSEDSIVIAEAPPPPSRRFLPEMLTPQGLLSLSQTPVS